MKIPKKLTDNDTNTKISYNELDRNDNIMTEPVDKLKDSKPNVPPKMINNDDNIAPLPVPIFDTSKMINIEKSIGSIGSVRTLNTQSEYYEKHALKLDEIAEARDTKSIETDSQISQNNVLSKSNIKRTNRVFFPKEKKAETDKLSDFIDIKILLPGREIMRKVTLKLIDEVPKNEP